MTQLFRLGVVELELREEVNNVFDEFNAVGYRQLPTAGGGVARIPRWLGRRVYNAEVRVRF